MNSGYDTSFLNGEGKQENDATTNLTPEKTETPAVNVIQPSLDEQSSITTVSPLIVVEEPRPQPSEPVPDEPEIITMRELLDMTIAA